LFVKALEMAALPTPAPAPALWVRRELQPPRTIKAGKTAAAERKFLDINLGLRTLALKIDKQFGARNGVINGEDCLLLVSR
jgi:hypothetical protein